MKNKIFWLLSMFLLLKSVGHAQDTKYENLEKQFKSLSLNSSPAYVVLGVEPENIQRPNSPNDFIAGVQSAIVNDKLQPNFALETTPYYWGKKKPDSKMFNVYDYISKNDFWSNLAKSFTFSMATSQSDSFTFGRIPVGTGLGLGMHMQLFSGSVSRTVKDNLGSWYLQISTKAVFESITNRLEADKGIDNIDDWLDDQLSKGSLKAMEDWEKDIVKDLIKQKIKKSSIAVSDSNKIRQLKEEAGENSAIALKKVNNYQFPLTREGFMLELSIANASVAGNNNWNKLQSAKTAIWLTPSYRFNINKDPEIIDFIDIMMVARITINAKNVDTSSYADVGAKLQWVHNKLSISGEGILRYLTKKPQSQLKGYTLRTGFTLSYKMNDMVTFKATFGSNFDGNSTHYSDPGKMFAVGGFQFGFSNFLKKESK